MGDTTIKLYKGSQCRECDEGLDTFLKGSKKQREQLKKINQTYSCTTQRFGIFGRDTWFLIFLPIIYISLKLATALNVCILYASVVNLLLLVGGVLVVLYCPIFLSLYPIPVEHGELRIALHARDFAQATFPPS